MHPHGQFDLQKEYKLKSIVGENKTKYLISWENDEVTGEPFEDTWEPKSHANQEAVEHWEGLKADKASKQPSVLCSLIFTNHLRRTSPEPPCSSS